MLRSEKERTRITGLDVKNRARIGGREGAGEEEEEEEEEEEQTICDEGRANIAVKEERTKPRTVEEERT